MGSPATTESRMLSATKYGSPTYTPKTHQTFLHNTLPSSYPIHMYPSWESYSAYPPLYYPESLFKGCNIRLNFLHDRAFNADSIPAYILRYHYVPRVYTSGWTALERLTAYERLLRFLTTRPISGVPNTRLGIAGWLNTARVEKVELGILNWPRGHWDSGFGKMGWEYEVVEKDMKRELERLIGAGKMRVGGEVGLKVTGRLEGCGGFGFRERCRESIQHLWGRSSVDGDGSDLGSSSPSDGSIDLWGKPTPSPRSSRNSSDRFLLSDTEPEFDGLDELAWSESIETSRGRKGLGWWTAVMSSQSLEQILSGADGLLQDVLGDCSSYSEPEFGEDVDEGLLDSFGFLSLDGGVRLHQMQHLQ